MTSYRKAVSYRKWFPYAGLYISALPPFSAALAVPHTRISTGVAYLAGGWNVADRHADALAAPYGDLDLRLGFDVSVPFLQATPRAAVKRAAWSGMLAHERALAAVWGVSTPHDPALEAEWGDTALKLADGAAMPYRVPAPHAHRASVPWGDLAARALSRSALWRGLVARGAYVALPWGPAGARSAGVGIGWPNDPDGETPPGDPITVPNLPVYVMLPTLTCVRLPDRTPIRLLGISLLSESGSWAWTFSAPIALADTALFAAPGGAPTEIEVRVNGYTWTFIVDGWDDNRRFRSNTATLRGRSRSGLLAEPHAGVRTFLEEEERTAAQLADQELPSEWTLLWDAPDWLVPGGTFSYQDLAPIDAIAQVASAIGATLSSDTEEKVLRVQPTYPVSPWEWSEVTPYAILPASILTAGDSSWQGGTNANGVYVYARDAASGGLVKIAGSDGANQLPMVVDTLAVHADAQRERGRNLLAGASLKRTVSRSLPLFPTPAPAGQPDLGPVPIGSLVEVQDAPAGGDGGEVWRGQVMSIRIDASRSGSALSVRQHLTIERHYR